jgi:hypothetical protein
MQIQIKHHCVCGGLEIPPGDYLVALASESQQIRLTGHGLDLKIPAVRRRAQSKGKCDSVTFFSGGGTSWSLIYMSPKLGEWISLIEKDNSK